MSKEVMQQALEALESAVAGMGGSYHIWEKECRPAIAALKEAIKQAAEPVAWYDTEYKDCSNVKRIGWLPLYTTAPINPGRVTTDD